MISDLDQSLMALLKHEAGRFPAALELQAKISVQLESADKPVSGTGPIVSLLLYDIREDVSKRGIPTTNIRDPDGRTTGRRPGTRFYQLSYLVSVIADEPATEHWVLGELLSALMLIDAIPDEHLQGRLRGEKVSLTKSLPQAADRSVGDLWSAVGRKLRPAIEVVAVAPLRPTADLPAATVASSGTLAVNELPRILKNPAPTAATSRPRTWGVTETPLPEVAPLERVEEADQRAAVRTARRRKPKA